MCLQIEQISRLCSLFMYSQYSSTFRSFNYLCSHAFIDYSSAFNTIKQSMLFDKLLNLNVDISLCYWIYGNW